MTSTPFFRFLDVPVSLCALLLGSLARSSGQSAPVSQAEIETTTNSIGMKLVKIRPGSFIMGQDGPASDYRLIKHPAKFDDADWDEKPAHRVTLTQSFVMGATEVTLGQYRQFKPTFRNGSGNDDDALRGV